METITKNRQAAGLVSAMEIRKRENYRRLGLRLLGLNREQVDSACKILKQIYGES